MKQIRLPYGKSYLDVSIPNERINGIIHNRINELTPVKSESEIVRESLLNPIGSKRLRELAKDKNNVVIIASDHTRPVPSKVIIPQMLDEIKAGNPRANITILIATGCHRGTTKEELKEKFGEQILNEVKIEIHDCTDEDNMVNIGTLPSGGELIINKTAYEADFLVSEGFIEPHFFAGFSGGRKSVLPGIASQKTVYANHCSAFIDNKNSRTGNLDGNPIHTDMLYAARKAKLSFIINVVINSDKKVIGSFAGDCDEAHLAGVDFLKRLCFSRPIYSDIVITTNNGYPLDQNIYQAVKGMTAAEATCNEGGVIIMVAKCEDGSGGDSFWRIFRDNPSAKNIHDKILSVAQSDTVADQWEAQILARILSKFKVILVSSADDSLVSDFHMIPAKTVEDAISIADRILQKDNAKITIIPEGISSIIL
jgi:nickel-dependent lactate racemase